MQVFWFIPTHGDGRYLGTSVGGRSTDLSYLQQIAQAVDRLGFGGVLIPTGRSCDDAWIVASTLISVTKRLKFLVAIRPGVMSPSVAARMAATFDRLSGGRLLVNVVAGGDPVELAGDGLHLDHTERYQLTDEFLTAWREICSGSSDFKGEYYDIRDGRLLFTPIQKPHPPLWFGGSSLIGQQVACKHVDTYLTWGEPPAQVAEKIASVRKIAEQEGRLIKFGVRLHVIVRETRSEAWEAANNLIRYVEDDAIAKAQQIYARMDSVGQRKMSELHGGKRDHLEVSPDLWAGVGLIRGGAGTALVGDPDTVAKRLLEYQDLGVESFILSGYPHLEESYRVAELLFPRLPLENLPQFERQVVSGPFGEILANEDLPKSRLENFALKEPQLTVD